MFPQTRSISLYSFGSFSTQQRWSHNFCKKVILLFLSYARHATENNRMNSTAYDITPFKLCRYQSLSNFEHNTVIKLHHMNTHKVHMFWLIKLWMIAFTSIYIMAKGKQNMVTKPWNMMSEWAESGTHFGSWSLSGFVYTHARYGHCIPPKKTSDLLE
jgi:hypothetical protein